MNNTEQHPTVLIIDDDANNVQILELDLEDTDYRTLSASDGVEGWEVLQQHKNEINVILLDRMMPNMNGMEFMQKLKADDTVAQIPVIMQTAAAEREQVTQGIEAGVYYYLTKPYEQETMLSIVRAAIKDHEELNALRQEVDQFKNQVTHRKRKLLRSGHPRRRTLPLNLLSQLFSRS